MTADFSSLFQRMGNAPPSASSDFAGGSYASFDPQSMFQRMGRLSQMQGSSDPAAAQNAMQATLASYQSGQNRFSPFQAPGNGYTGWYQGNMLPGVARQMGYPMPGAPAAPAAPPAAAPPALAPAPAPPPVGAPPPPQGPIANTPHISAAQYGVPIPVTQAAQASPGVHPIPVGWQVVHNHDGTVSVFPNR